MKKVLCTTVLLTMAAPIVHAQASNDDQMLALTQSVLQGLNNAAPEKADASGGKDDLSSLITQAMEQGQSDDYLEALIGEAVNSGAVEVPDAMVSTEGDVDTRTLLASIVNQSLGGDSTEDILIAEAAGATPVAALDVSTVRQHTVVRGESLARIALDYYGDASKYEQIFAANRDTIERPNLIRVGQVILIP